MKRPAISVLGMLLVCHTIVGGAQQERDVQGSKDHPILSRMLNYYISGYQENRYDVHEFYDEADNEFVIEGHKWIIEYTLREGYTPPGQLNVFQNHINAVKKIGGDILYDRGLYMKVVREGLETWIEVWATDDGSDYRLTIVQRTALEQEVVADPEAMAKDIEASGHVAVYGIYFDFDSYAVKPESKPTLEAISELLRIRPDLNVYIVGHTDMTGTLAYNMDLSSKRAQAVVDVLVRDYGIASARLQAQGIGPLCPVSTNRTEEGRKLNRRVELVEK